MVEQRKVEREKELAAYNQVKKAEEPLVKGNNDFHTQLLNMEA